MKYQLITQVQPHQIILRRMRGTFVIVIFLMTIFLVVLLRKQDIIQSHTNYRLVVNNVSEKEQLQTLLKCRNKSLRMQMLYSGGYWILENLIRGRLSSQMECWESITYTTIGDYTFVGHVTTVVKRWMGPISFALFAPGYDFSVTMDAIQYVRNCLPESELVRDYVTFHIYFPNDHMPDERVPLSEEEAFEWPFDCEMLEAPYEQVDRATMYKTMKNLTYPINVGRNIARFTANTHFIFPCDIELYPSLGFIDQFLDMALRNVTLVRRDVGDGGLRRVFPLPVFEIESNAAVPDTKQQLVAMLQTKKAIPFHQRICKGCHKVPKQDEWIKANVSDKLEIFTVAKRQGRFVRWEPFYVSDNTEPSFDERVTWEGQSNKRIQNYAMCLLDYEYHVLHPAFLVHAPGIKRFHPKSKRLRYARAMRKFIAKKIKPEYKILYGRNKKCKV